MVSTLGLKSCVCKDGFLSPDVAGFLVWNRSQCRDSVSSARVDPALNECFEKSGKGKQVRRAKAKDYVSPIPYIAIPG